MVTCCTRGNDEAKGDGSKERRKWLEGNPREPTVGITAPAAVVDVMKKNKGSRPGDTAVPPAEPRTFKVPEDAPGGSFEMTPARAQLLQSLREANERCIEMLRHAARTEARDTFSLVNQLRPLFRSLTPETRARAAPTGPPPATNSG